MTHAATYLPSIHANGVTGQSDTANYADVFAAAWVAFLGDVGRRMVRDARLDAAAQGQADWLAVHDFDRDNAHLGADGSTPNERVRATGYRLPDFWPTRGNQCESANHSWSEPAQSLIELATHDTHAEHMQVRGWWAHSTVYGVGAARASVGGGGWFVVAVTAPREG